MTDHLRARSYCFVAILLMALLVGPVWAQTDNTEAPPSIQDRVNGFFDRFVNSFINQVLFYGVGLDPVGEITGGDRYPVDDAGYALQSDESGAIVTGEDGAPTRYLDAAGNLLLFSGHRAQTVTAEGEVLDTREGAVIVRSIPVIVCVLFLGGFFFTVRYGFVNLRLFRHSIDVIRGRYDKPDHEGEVSHFRALTSALSATVGLGNISGVAVAISMGGPGAVFWMWFTAFFGMSLKFSSCTLAQLYRRIGDDGCVLGGPMVYLEMGLKEKGFAVPGRMMAILFSVLTILAAFGGGNMFQSNQTYSLFETQVLGTADAPSWAPWVFGFLLAIPVGIVIIGGIKRIGEVTARMVPTMCIFYCAICLTIVLLNLSDVPEMFASIFTKAFSSDALFGGFVGVLVQGMRRAAFSNEAGMGSAAIAHAAAKTDEPVREGVVAMIGPFIDTIIVCTMTALAILITGAHVGNDLEGIEITAAAFGQLGPVVPYILFIAVFVFAFSSVISWGYYGERATEYLFGKRGILPYRAVFVAIVVLGPVLSLQAVIDFSDAVMLSMAFPNIVGMLFLSGKVKGLVDDYVARLRSGEMKMVDAA